MQYDPDIFDVLCTIIITEFGIAPHLLTPDTVMFDLDLDQQEYDELYRLMSEKTGVTQNDIFLSMPVRNYGESEATMNSLRNIAPFNRSAAAYLMLCDVQFDQETIGSIAASFTQGKYVQSGLLFPPTLPPHSAINVLVRLVALPLIFAFFLPYLYTLWRCNPFQWYCGWNVAGRLDDVVHLIIFMSLIYIASALLPGIVALWHRKARLQRRSKR